LDQQLEF
jgi:hypothetical protein